MTVAYERLSDPAPEAAHTPQARRSSDTSRHRPRATSRWPLRPTARTCRRHEPDKTLVRGWFGEMSNTSFSPISTL